ncbi:MAG: hypothetical protein QXT63_04320 [Thermoplasmata archaeon]
MAAKKKTTRKRSSKKSTISAVRLGEAVGRAIGEAAVTVIKETKEPKKTEKRCTRNTKKSVQALPATQVQKSEQQYYPCARCGQPLAYIVQYREWYCYQCKAYASELVRGKEEVPPPPPPGTYLVSDQ